MRHLPAKLRERNATARHHFPALTGRKEALQM
jgi:hypothetical protein